MVDSFLSKKGTSLVELIAYVVLYGVVMSLLATLVFVLITATRKVNRQAILNRGAKLLYTDFLAQSISFNADFVTINETINDTVSITLEKHYRYNDEGDRIKIVADDSEYADKPVKLTYSYTKGQSKMFVKYEKLDGTSTNNSIDLGFGMTITSSTAGDTDITKVFYIINKSSSNKSLVFNGMLNYDQKTLEFNYVVPIYVVTE